MITFRITTDVKDDRRVVLTLPAEVPTGQAELVVSVESPAPGDARPSAVLADWVEAQAGRDGDKQVRYPLRGCVLRYEQPTEPVAESDWEALR
jgi:hypothetical protein